MHKQMTVFKNMRVLFATALFLLAAVLFALFGYFGISTAYAAEGDDVEPEQPPITVDETGNRIFDEVTKTEYTLPVSWVYGTYDNVPTPEAEHEGTGEDAGELDISLYLNHELIASGIEPYNLGNYINKCMPAGDYSLVMTSPNVTKGDVFYGTKSYTFNFIVECAPMPTEYVTEVANALTTGKPNEYIYDGAPKFYSNDITFDFIESGKAVYDRGFGSQIYWASEEADKYFGGIELKLSMDAEHYHPLDYYKAYYASNKKADSEEAGNEEIDFDCDPILPCEPGMYTVYYMLVADNYSNSVDISSVDRTGYYFDVTVFGVVDIPPVPSVIYNGESQKGYITDSLYYTVEAYNGWDDAGTYNITLQLRNPSCYLWQGQTLETRTPNIRVPFTITKANNDWVQLPDVVRWVEGKYDPEENLVIGESKFGRVKFVITDADDNVVYSSVDGINKLGELKAGIYNFSASVEGTDNYNVLSYSKFIRVLAKQGLPWWGTLCIAVGALLVAALIILILYKKGVFRLLTDKIILAIRTKATIDATIAAVRANKIAEQSRASREQAEARDRAAEQAAARKQAAEEARNKPQEEKVAELEAKAKATADKAEAMRQKAEAMQARADGMKAKAAENAEKPEDTQTTATDADTTPEHKEN